MSASLSFCKTAGATNKRRVPANATRDTGTPSMVAVAASVTSGCTNSRLSVTTRASRPLARCFLAKRKTTSSSPPTIGWNCLTTCIIRIGHEPWLIGAFGARQSHGRPQQNFDVEPDRPVLDVVQVAGDPPSHVFRGSRFPTQPVHLGPAGNAGLDPMPPWVEL